MFFIKILGLKLLIEQYIYIYCLIDSYYYKIFIFLTPPHTHPLLFIPLPLNFNRKDKVVSEVYWTQDILLR